MAEARCLDVSQRAVFLDNRWHYLLLALFSLNLEGFRPLDSEPYGRAGEISRRARLEPADVRFGPPALSLTFENGGELEITQRLASQADISTTQLFNDTTQLYDRRKELIIKE